MSDTAATSQLLAGISSEASPCEAPPEPSSLRTKWPSPTTSELKTAVANWQHRTTTSFTGRVAEFIALFEAGANATIRLRENEIEKPLVATPSSPFIDLPADYQAPVSLEADRDAAPACLRAARPAALPSGQGPSRRWTVKDTRIQTERDADQAYAYTLRYHRRFALSDAAADQHPADALSQRLPLRHAARGRALCPRPRADRPLAGPLRSRERRARQGRGRIRRRTRRLPSIRL